MRRRCGQILVIPVRLLEYDSVRACELVDAGELDVALANLDYYNIDDLNHHVVMEDSYVHCVSRTHRFISFAAQYELV